MTVEREDPLAKFLDGETQEVAELRRVARDAQRLASRRDVDRRALVEAVYQAARDAKVAAGRVPVWHAPKRGKGGQVLPLLHTTDWQCGKITSDFSMSVLGDRLSAMMDKAAALTADVSTSRSIGRAHLAFGGDMVEGITIFPGQAYQVEATLYAQLFEAVKLECAVVDRALETWGEVEVWEEYGNHGRIGRKGELPAQDNFDLMSYRIAQQRYLDHPGVTWHPATSWHQVMELGAYRALLVHGDEINSYGGNHPSYGIVKKVQQWQSGVVAPFTDCYMGHFHRPDTYTLAAGGSVFITGSPESGNEYAREFMAATGRPSQRLHLVDPERGMVWSEHRLWLD